MAKRVLLDVTFTLGGTSYTAYLNAITWKINKAEVDASNFGQTSETYELGMASWSVDLSVRPETDQAFRKYLLQRIDDGADAALVFRPQNAVKGATNPEVTGNVKVSTFPGMGGTHGALEGENTFTLKGNGQCVWDDGTTTITIGA